MSRLAAAPLAAIVLLGLTGCGWLFGASGSGGGSTLSGDLRTALPAIEAYHADHAGYEGVTMERLREYDPGIPSSISLPVVEAGAYCAQASRGGDAVHIRGPGGEIAPGPCA